jgi:hypothetical protein
MRNVGESNTDSVRHLEDRIGYYSSHLDAQVLQFKSIQQSMGLEEALKSTAAQLVAQYHEVVSALSSVLEDGGDCAGNLACFASAAVMQTRDLDIPRWKSLATATILEVLVECCGSGR